MAATNTVIDWRTMYANAKIKAQQVYNEIKTNAKDAYKDARVYVTDTIIIAQGALKQSRQNKINASFDKLTAMNNSLTNLQSAQAGREAYMNYASKSFNPFVKLKGWAISKKYNKYAKREQALIAHIAYEENRQQMLANKFKNKYGNEMGYIGRKSSKGIGFDFNNNPEATRKERDAHLNKIKDPFNYSKTKSDLDPAEIYSPDGKFMAHYKHFNSIDNSVEIDLSNPVRSGVCTNKGIVFQEHNKVELKLNENHELDLSLPENQAVVNDPKFLKDVLKEHPEAYKTIPSQYFDKTMGGKLDRNDVLDMVREGVKEKINTASRSSNGEYYTNIPAKDEFGNYLGRSATTREFAESIYNDVIEKDKELHSYTEQMSPAYKSRQMHLQSQAKFAKYHATDKDVDEFFDKAK